MFRSLSRILAEVGGSHRAAARPRPALRVEALESRWVPSTIAGFVYNDLAATGLYQQGTDPVYANNPISLLNAAGLQIASTTTDANGHYSFNVNQTINTDPVTAPAETGSFGPVSTESSGAASVNQFDPSLGTLQSVEIDLTGTVTSKITVQDLNDSSTQTTAETLQSGLTGDVKVQGPGAAALDASVQGNEPDVTLNAGESHTFDPLQASNTASVTLTDAASLAAFTGQSGAPGTVSFGVSGKAQVNSDGGGGNLESAIRSTISGQVKVIYTYKPSNTLTPGQYTVVQTANPPGTSDGVNSSNGTPVPAGTPHDTIPVTLPPGGDSLQNNFGEVVPAKVSGFVYLDNNKDGQFNAGDAAIPNATVTLSGATANGAGTISMTTQTAADGSYSFTAPPGTYTITQPEIPGLLAGSDTVGNLGGTAAPDALTMTLKAADNGVNYNFGEIQAAPPPIVPPVIPTPPPPPVVPPVVPQTPPPPPVTPQTPPDISKIDFFGGTMWMWGL